jgi:ABC-2 type transport system ATP-binding protein
MKAADVLARMVKDGLRITEFHREQRNLEDAFIDILGRLDAGQSAIAPPPMPREEVLRVEG